MHGQIDSSVTFWKICAFLFFCREFGQVLGATNLTHLAAKTLLAEHRGDRTKGNEGLLGQRSDNRYPLKKKNLFIKAVTL